VHRHNNQDNIPPRETQKGPSAQLHAEGRKKKSGKKKLGKKTQEKK
jgi:hypothetical protein